jgi:hypothetical protein
MSDSSAKYRGTVSDAKMNFQKRCGEVDKYQDHRIRTLEDEAFKPHQCSVQLNCMLLIGQRHAHSWQGRESVGVLGRIAQLQDRRELHNLEVLACCETNSVQESSRV